MANDANTIKSLLNSSFDGLTKSDAINDLEKVNEDIVDAEDDVVDNLYDAMHGHTNKYAIRLTKAIFALTLIFSFLGLTILIIFLFFKNTCLKIIYIFIWNVSMLLVILAIIEAASLGIIGYLLEDAVQVGNYILSSENLKSNDPLVFKNNNENNYISDLIEICANGDGNFTNVIEGGQELNSHLDGWKQNKSSFIQRRESINCNGGDKLKKYYDQLIGFVDQSLNMTYNITNVTCRFARNDKNIILNEADSGGNNGIALSGLGFLVGILLGISVFAGIIFIHKFYSTWKEENKREINHVNDSSTDIRQENNNITTNPNNNTMPYPNNNVMPYPNNNMMPYPNNNMRPYPNNEINPK